MLFLDGFTTADIRSPALPKALAAALRRAFPDVELWVRWLPADAETPRKRRLSEVDDGELARIYALGSIGLGDRAFGALSAGIEWNRVARREHRRFLGGSGYRQNTVHVETELERLASPAFRVAWIALCRELAAAFGVNWLASGASGATRLVVGGEQGLGAGLPGVYWINVFGPPFVELIGGGAIRVAPGRTEALEGGRLLLEADDAILDPARAGEVAAALRAALGEEHFVPTAPIQMAASGSFSILRLPLELWRMRRAAADENRLAPRRPRFDFREILVEDDAAR